MKKNLNPPGGKMGFNFIVAIFAFSANNVF